MTWRFYVTLEEPEFSTDIRDFTALFYVILRRKSSEWLESSIEGVLGMWFSIWEQIKFPATTRGHPRVKIARPDDVLVEVLFSSKQAQ